MDPTPAQNCIKLGHCCACNISIDISLRIYTYENYQKKLIILCQSCRKVYYKIWRDILEDIYSLIFENDLDCDKICLILYQKLNDDQIAAYCDHQTRFSNFSTKNQCDIIANDQLVNLKSELIHNTDIKIKSGPKLGTRYHKTCKLCRFKRLFFIIADIPKLTLNLAPKSFNQSSVASTGSVKVYMTMETIKSLNSKFGQNQGLNYIFDRLAEAYLKENFNVDYILNENVKILLQIILQVRSQKTLGVQKIEHQAVLTNGQAVSNKGSRKRKNDQINLNPQQLTATDLKPVLQSDHSSAVSQSHGYFSGNNSELGSAWASGAISNSDDIPYDAKVICNLAKPVEPLINIQKLNPTQINVISQQSLGPTRVCSLSGRLTSFNDVSCTGIFYKYLLVFFDKMSRSIF